MAINEMVRKVVLIFIMRIILNIVIRLLMFIGAIIVCFHRILMTASNVFFAMIVKAVFIVYFVSIFARRAIVYTTSSMHQKNMNWKNKKYPFKII